MMSDENLITLTVEERLNNAQVEIQKLHMMMQDDARDRAITLAMLQHFVTRYVERGDDEQIKDALSHAYFETLYDWDTIAETVERLGICDPELCQREYNVTITVPVSVTVSIFAMSAENAEEVALTEVDCNGLDNYYMEFDLWNNAEFYVEES